MKKVGFLNSSLSLAYLLIGLFALRWTLVEPYIVPTGSMEPTLKTGDKLFAFKAAYDVRFPFTNWVLFRTGKIHRGDVILFTAPHLSAPVTFVKRALGLPGDRVEFREGHVFINGEEVARGPAPKTNLLYDIERKEDKELMLENLGGVRHYLLFDRVIPNARTVGEQRIPEGYVMAIGDHRDNSSDSRAWGFVPMDNIKGKAMFIWFSAWDPALKDNFSRVSSILDQAKYFVINTFVFLFDWVQGKAWIRTERIGTLIQ